MCWYKWSVWIYRYATESCLNALDKALGGYEEASANNVTYIVSLSMVRMIR